jgi:hypothetical protein
MKKQGQKKLGQTRNTILSNENVSIKHYLKSNQKQLRNDPIIRLQIIIPDLTTEKQTISKNEKEQNKP